MTSNPTSHFITLLNRPVVQENGEITQGPLKLHYWEWEGHKPTILFCHATSFHGRSYDRIIREALQGFHVIALDFRGHGRSQQHPPPYRFRWIGEDVIQFIETLNLPKDDLIGIGHSLGGYALVCAAATAPTRLFRSLLLFDPGVLPRSMYGSGDNRVEAFDYILRRKTHWSSIDDMILRFEQRKPFSQWPKDVLRDYCTYALDENYKLLCTPEGEHAMYQSSLQSDTNIYPFIEQSKYIHDIPIHIVRSELPVDIGKFETSPTEPDLAKWFRRGRATQINHVQHFFPMEQPEMIVDIIKEMLKENPRSHL